MSDPERIPSQNVGKIIPDRTPRPPVAAPPPEHQFKVRLPDDVLTLLNTQALELGFYTENAAAATYLKAFAKVPPNKVWEVLAKVAAYHPAPPRKGRR